MTVRVWCLRHGEAESNVARSMGAWPEAALTSRGQEQAARAAERLAPEPITALYASTAARAAGTAEILAGPRGLEVVRLAELGEVEIGPGCDPADRRTGAAAAEALRQWVVEGRWERRFVGGETGHDVVARMTAALEQVVRAGQEAAVVGHVASLTVVMRVLCGLQVWGRPLPYATPFLVEYDGNWRSSGW